jgi:ABC-2 type transport system permease protein
MNGSVARHLIRKDLRFHKPVILFSIVGGAIALAIAQLGGDTALVIGTAFFFISLIFCASVLPSNIVNERNKQTLPFLMSLPISSVQYGAAKLVSTVGMFLLPWLTLAIAALWLIAVRHAFPNGTIPLVLILAMAPFVGFCITTFTALVVESEGWTIAATAVVNSSYWLVWYLLVSRFPALTQDWKSSAVVWSPVALNILGVEFALIVVVLGLALYLQSRKRVFI